mmetsp:Transcript_20785/g.45778  ORF Transcript_20785/g.45778 Transcript_20785/m.45778 type:complete len:182 (-) Transcript_20785:68-613(-)
MGSKLLAAWPMDKLSKCDVFCSEVEFWKGDEDLAEEDWLAWSEDFAQRSALSAQKKLAGESKDRPRKESETWRHDCIRGGDAQDEQDLAWLMGCDTARSASTSASLLDTTRPSLGFGGRDSISTVTSSRTSMGTGVEQPVEAPLGSYLLNAGVLRASSDSWPTEPRIGSYMEQRLRYRWAR